MLEERCCPPVSRHQIARFAGAVRDFNPVHVDEEFARSVGMPSVIAHGPLTLALALDTIVAQVGVEHVRRFEVRFKTPFLPGESLTVAPVGDRLELRTDAGAVMGIATLDMTT